MSLEQRFHLAYLLEYGDYRAAYLSRTSTQFISDPDYVLIIEFLKAGNFSYEALLKAHGQKVLAKAMELANLAGTFEMQKRLEEHLVRIFEEEQCET